MRLVGAGHLEGIGAPVKLEEKIERLSGPVLVLGASGFIGANLLRTLLKVRKDVFGNFSHLPAWRLEGIPSQNLVQADLLVDSNLDSLFGLIAPRTVFNCVAYGAYSFETERDLIYQTNFLLTSKILQRLEEKGISAYIHAGSSSEYGENGAGPAEDAPILPNSDYAVSKASCNSLMLYYGKKRKLPCANLRLYSAYGPLEDSSRLIPNLVRAGAEKGYPELADPEISRDFVYVEDVCEAFVDAALALKPSHYGESFNIGSGRKTTLREVAKTARKVFRIEAEPSFGTLPNRSWDLKDWFADTRKTKKILRWEARTPFAEGLKRTADWYQGLEDRERYHLSSKRFELDSKHSVSAVVACYKDGQAIPILYGRLKAVFEKLKIDHEIIFVNDNSPDDSEAVILELSSKNRRVIGISHSRNFGSQAAFRSGMEIATKNACVLLDGDLQDPPELIEQFVAKWREGYDVVFGRRIKRQATLPMQLAYKLFYRIFDLFSYLSIPHDAGDFSLMDQRVVKAMLRFPERDLFLRGVRAFVGFKQVGVDYVRPERVFGRSTNSLLRNLNWAKKGILSFSYTPLTIVSFMGTFLFFFSILLAAFQVSLRLLYPELAPRGITTVLLAILFFGSLNLFALAILGEYLAKVFEEVKRRPHFVRRTILRNGEARASAPEMPDQRETGP
jgi:dolichol-phosphate mannosyltransferase